MFMYFEQRTDGRVQLFLTPHHVVLQRDHSVSSSGLSLAASTMLIGREN
jgi:hypothetical protein